MLLVVSYPGTEPGSRQWRAFLVAQVVKKLPAMQETQV